MPTTGQTDLLFRGPNPAMRCSILLTFVLMVAACGDDREPATSELASTTATTTVPTSTTAASVENPLPDGDDEPLEANATIERIVDGDTIVAEVQGQTERVRLIGIDTPESVAENRPEQCYGVESADYLTTLIPPGTPVTLIRDVEARDQFDRLLAYVVRSSDGLFVNLDLVANGYAGPFTYPPNDHYADVLERAAADAAAADLGLWGACGGPDVPLG